jgi:predicted dehydrogenase
MQIGNNEPLKVEQQAFLKAVADKSKLPEVSAEEGLAAMECAQEILASIRRHRWDR